MGVVGDEQHEVGCSPTPLHLIGLRWGGVLISTTRWCGDGEPVDDLTPKGAVVGAGR